MNSILIKDYELENYRLSVKTYDVEKLKRLFLEVYRKGKLDGIRNENMRIRKLVKKEVFKNK